MKSQNYRIVNESMGSFLTPFGHASQRYSVKNYDGQMSLDHALEDKDVPENLKEKIKKLLEDNPVEFTEDWEHSCYNYFRNCYSPDGINRNVSNCIIDKTNNKPPKHHLAYLHIKSYFPDYEPNLFLIHNNGDKGSWSDQ